MRAAGERKLLPQRQPASRAPHNARNWTLAPLRGGPVTSQSSRMASDVSILAALVAGIISFLSPCVLPLVPPYLVYLTGATVEHVAAGEPPAVSRRAVMGAACMFVHRLHHRVRGARRQRQHRRRAGARLVGGAGDRRRHRHHRHGPAFPRPHAHRPSDARRAARHAAKPVGLWGAYAMGLAFAFGWTPCIGPILAAILAVAASEATVDQGRGPAGGLFGRARHSVPAGRFRGEAASRRCSRASSISSSMSSARWAC